MARFLFIVSTRRSRLAQVQIAKLRMDVFQQLPLEIKLILIFSHLCFQVIDRLSDGREFFAKAGLKVLHHCGAIAP